MAKHYPSDGARDVVWGDNVIHADFGARRRISNAAPATKAKARSRSKRQRLELITPNGEMIYESLIADVDVGRQDRGERYFFDGNVVGIEYSDSLISGFVMGSQPEPFQVDIRLPYRSDVPKVFEYLVQNPEAMADLEDGHLAAAQLTRLTKADDEEYRFHCTCPDAVEVCKHVVAIAAQVASDIDTEPLLVFQLRGYTEAEVHSKIAELVKQQAQTRRRQASRDLALKRATQLRASDGDLAAFEDADENRDIQAVQSDFWGRDLPDLDLPNPVTISVYRETDRNQLYEALKQATVLTREAVRAMSDLEECWDLLSEVPELAVRDLSWPK